MLPSALSLSPQKSWHGAHLKGGGAPRVPAAANGERRIKSAEIWLMKHGRSTGLWKPLFAPEIGDYMQRFIFVT